MDDMREKKAVLMQASTGSGKTIIFSEIIKRYLTEYAEMKIGVVSHRQGLVVQSMEKLMEVWPEGYELAGMACASAGKVRVDDRIVIGTIQTMSRRVFEEPFDLIIIDEAHNLPPMNKNSAYRRLILANEKGNKNLRIMGVTATPFRLNHGYIYGNKCRPGYMNWFQDLNFQAKMNDLVRDGYLAPWRAKQPVDIAADLKKIKLKKGEYDDTQLTDLLVKDRHMKSAVEAYQLYGENRKHCLIFAVTIEHAEALRNYFQENGHSAGIVHSKMSKDDREEAINAFREGRTNFLVNVGILTEGWDCPQVDLIIMCRPTKSPGLFVQIIGRGTRKYEGKADVLILDMVNNFREHGDPAEPEVKWRKKQKPGESPIKVCPGCKEIIANGYKACPLCGYEFQADEPEKKVINKAPVMEEVLFNPPAPVKGYREMKVAGCKVFLHTVKSERNFGKHMLGLAVKLIPPNGGSFIRICVYLDIEGAINSDLKNQAGQIWRYVTNGAQPPVSVFEAMNRYGDIKLPETLKVDPTKRFKEIKEFNEAGAVLTRLNAAEGGRTAGLLW
jgi:DNA repair protein RadD